MLPRTSPYPLRPLLGAAIVLVSVGGGARAAAAQEPPWRPPASRELTTAIERYLDARPSFSGVVLAAHGDSTLVELAHGLAERELGVPLEMGHVFRIGSLTKPITAAVVVLLAQEGRWRLSDPVCGWLPTCPPGWERVRLEHLLTHRSGLPDLFGELRSVPVEETGAELERVLREAETTPRAAPGERYAYANFNYVLLAYALEKETGEPWERVLEARLLDPLGMNRTAYDDVWALVPGRARGYRLRRGQIAHVEYDDHAAYAAGGLYSTAADLRRFATALFRGEVLDTAWLRRSLEPPEGSDYGYGWQTARHHGRRAVQHNGGIDGFSSHLAWYPEEDLLVVVLSNLEQGDARGTACDVAAAAFGVREHRSLADRRPVATTPGAAARLAGTYAGEGDPITIEAADDGLVYVRGRSRIRMQPLAEDLFFLDTAADVFVRFEEGGRALALERCGATIVSAARRP